MSFILLSERETKRKIMNKKWLGFISLGCAKNFVDSEEIIGNLVNQGYHLTPKLEDSDLVIVNTCAFLRDARKEAYRTIQEISRIKKSRGSKIKKLCVVGCLAQYFSEKKLKKLFPEIDLVVPINCYHQLPALLKNGAGNGAGEAQPLNKKSTFHNKSRFLTTSPHSVYVKIAEGCDNSCSYCLIPSLRGSLRSKTIDDILYEVKAYQKMGAKEINLIAQDTTAYGKDLYGKYMLAKLLEQAAKIKGIHWIRILYAHPARFSNDLLKVIANEPNICNYIDLPIQHISDKILASMHRKVTKEEIISLYSRIRDYLPGVVLRTTVMIGYPGEGEDEFAELAEFLQQYPFERLGGFVFSPEKRTPAFHLQARASNTVALDRIREIMEKQRSVSREFNRSLLGKNVEVLIDQYKTDRGRALARMFSQAPEVDGKIILTKARDIKAGDIVKAKITGIGTYDLMGEINK
jgi:ribosomal protein S12 methylthiotransferase